MNKNYKERIKAILGDAEYYKEMGYNVNNPMDVAQILMIADDWEDTSEDFTKEEIEGAIAATKATE